MDRKKGVTNKSSEAKSNYDEEYSKSSYRRNEEQLDGCKYAAGIIIIMLVLFMVVLQVIFGALDLI
ncbi:MAG: hypothetical protein IJA15_05900 [Clostridia bacterium]|nr:hypothetical protein [Clostridia bacterium]